MAYRMVWVNDSVDDQAERSDRLTYAEAARRADRHVKWVAKMIRYGGLRTVEYMGRTYVDGRSLATLLQRSGVGFTPGEVADELDESGDHLGAMEIRRAMQDRENARMASMGYEPSRPASSSPVARDIPSPADSFLEKFVKGKGGV